MSEVRALQEARTRSVGPGGTCPGRPRWSVDRVRR
jgi:hypothetical protein